MINPQSYTFSFGKYKGKEYKSVVNWVEGVQYAIWAHDNVSDFILPQEEYDRLRKARLDYNMKKTNYKKGGGWTR